jgi:hypothetical protein
MSYGLDSASALTDTGRSPAEARSDALDPWALAYRRAPHTIANLGRVHLQLCQRPAQGVAMHAELLGSLALIAFVLRKNFKDVAPLELADRIRIGNSGTVHLNDKTVQFALQRLTPRWSSNCDTSPL